MSGIEAEKRFQAALASFAPNLRRLRARQGLSARDAAELCSVGKSTWYRYETGTAHPNFPALIRIADAFRVRLDDLVDLEPNREGVF